MSVKKHTQTHVYREQISGYQWGERMGERQASIEGLRDTNYCA